jgi:hypothetical protein
MKCTSPISTLKNIDSIAIGMITEVSPRRFHIGYVTYSAIALELD